ncbi:MAG: ferritin [Parachlamydiales bacterium]|nr:ferritin [Parachlamydiales bacterium]
MLSSNIEKAFNKQINEEYFSAYLYLSMSAYFESINLKGFAHWMKIQAQEEAMHAMKFFNYINERGSKVTLLDIKAPKNIFNSPEDAFKEVVLHEKLITTKINDLINLVNKENDHASNAFLQWYVIEQVEEEANANQIYERLKMIQDFQGALFMLDKELESRQLPAATNGK